MPAPFESSGFLKSSRPLAIAPTTTAGVWSIIAPMVVGSLLSLVLIGGIRLAGAGRSRSAAAGSERALADVPARVMSYTVNVDSGHALYMANCSSCHGAAGEGMPMQGADLRRSHFVQTRSNEQLMAFLLLGRQPGDRYTVLGRAMPARGGNPLLGDADLADIVAYLRRLQLDAASASLPTTGAPTPAAAAVVISAR